MSFKKLGMALLAVVVLGAIMANSAFAENSFVAGGSWVVGGTKLAEGEANAKALTTEANEASTLTTTVAKTPLVLSSSKINCLTCAIQNSGVTTAVINGKLKFEEVKVVEPAGCSVTGGAIESKALVATLGMGGTGTGATLKFVPKAGETTAFALVELEGASCPISGLYKVTGSQFGESANATKSFAETQEVITSAAIQASAGTPGSLKFGENPATLAGKLKGTLTSKASWGGEE